MAGKPIWPKPDQMGQLALLDKALFKISEVAYLLQVIKREKTLKENNFKELDIQLVLEKFEETSTILLYYSKKEEEKVQKKKDREYHKRFG